MDRRSELLKNLTREHKGIEVGPYFSPVASKKAGYDCLSLDVFDTETLKQKAAVDPEISSEKIADIEPVDLVGSALSIDELCGARGELGAFDYIVSSHNFEHLPNPVKFLQGCGRVLKNGGVLSMAMPDKRACFDFFRPRTSLGAWIEAYFEGRERPNLPTIFEQDSLFGHCGFGDALGAISSRENPGNHVARRGLREAYDAWRGNKDRKDLDYCDVHCSTLTPNSFTLLCSDLEFLGLSPFTIEHVSNNRGAEFFVRLRNEGYKTFDETASREYYDKRQKLLAATAAEESNDLALSVLHSFANYISERYTATKPRESVPKRVSGLFSKKKAALEEHFDAVKNSIFFDENFYVRQNPAIAMAGVEPARHYLLRGAREGLDPGPFFSTRIYLEGNPDVAEAGVNALAHYELFGRKEGRALPIIFPDAARSPAF